nr:PX domain-containing protein kinase-like protein [Salvelinus alpinus]
MAFLEKQSPGRVLLDDTVALTALIEASQNLQSHTEYIIRVQRGVCTENSWQVIKRYSDFDMLNSSLLVSGVSLPLPPKKLLGNMDREFIAERQRGLQVYLDFITQHHILATCQLVKKFLDTNNYSANYTEIALQQVSMFFRSDPKWEVVEPLKDIGWRIRKKYFLIKNKEQPKERQVLSWVDFGPDKFLSDKDLQSTMKLLPSLTNPYIYPVTFANTSELSALVIRMFNEKGTLRDLICKVRLKVDLTIVLLSVDRPRSCSQVDLTMSCSQVNLTTVLLSGDLTMAPALRLILTWSLSGQLYQGRPSRPRTRAGPLPGQAQPGPYQAAGPRTRAGQARPRTHRQQGPYQGSPSRLHQGRPSRLYQGRTQQTVPGQAQQTRTRQAQQARTRACWPWPWYGLPWYGPAWGLPSGTGLPWYGPLGLPWYAALDAAGLPWYSCYSGIYPAVTYTSVVSVLQSILSTDACKTGMPTVAQLLQTPLFSDVLLFHSEKLQFKIPNKLRDALKTAKECMEKRLQEEQKTNQQHRRLTRAQSHHGSEEEKRRRKILARKKSRQSAYENEEDHSVKYNNNSGSGASSPPTSPSSPTPPHTTGRYQLY